MVLKPTRREILKLAGASFGGALLAGSARLRAAGSGTATPASTDVPPTVAALKSYLQSHASATYSLPPLMALPPSVSWAGPLSNSSAPTSLPGGNVYAASNAAFGGPIRRRFTASLSGNPIVNGLPALAVRRPYACKGQARWVGSPNILRFSTDAPVLELAGVVTVNSFSAQTLIVDGQLALPQVVSVSNGAPGGYNFVTVRIDFGARAMRDIWLETGIWLAYVKLGAGDTLVAATDGADPQMTVVGDLFVASGSNAFGNGAALALEIGARLGIGKVAVDAVAGSGYWNSGYDIGNLNDRVQAHAADGSTIYLVAAGFNDYADLIVPPENLWPTRAQYEAAVNGYFQALRAAQPNAVIVATAPFCPNPTLSDASFVQNSATNSSGLGDFPYKSQLQKSALTQIAGPWVWIDVLMGGGWLNSSGASGGSSGLQWLTGGSPLPGTTATIKPGNVTGGSGGGFGGLASVPILSGGSYSQAPDIAASRGTGTGLMLASRIDGTGRLVAVDVIQPGVGYTSGEGLPLLTVDPTFQQLPATLGAPVLMSGVNAGGSYPLPAFAPAGVPGGYSNAYVNLMPDLTHPSPAGIDYLASRLAQSLYEAIIAL
jgi:lysophospholipase L1-like esterase